MLLRGLLPSGDADLTTADFDFGDACWIDQDIKGCAQVGDQGGGRVDLEADRLRRNVRCDLALPQVQRILAHELDAAGGEHIDHRATCHGQLQVTGTDLQNPSPKSLALVPRRGLLDRAWVARRFVEHSVRLRDATDRG